MIADFAFIPIYVGAACPVCAAGQARSGGILLFAAMAALPLVVGAALLALLVWFLRRL
jgi:hypothetical protein